VPSVKIDCEPKLHQNVAVGGNATCNILLGRTVDSGRKRNVYFDADHNFVVLEVGKRGSGKSFGLGAALEAFATDRDSCTIATHGTPRRAVLLLDPLDIHWTAIYPLRESGSAHIKEQYKLLKSWPDMEVESLRVKVFVPAGREIPEDPKEFRSYYLPISFLWPEDFVVLYGANLHNDPPGMLITELYDKVTRIGYSHASRTILPKGEFGLADFINCTDDPEIQNNYSSQTIRAVRQRLIAWQRDPLFQKTTGTPVTELVTPGELSILCLNRLSEDVRSVLAGVIVRRIKAERSRTSQIERRQAFDPVPPQISHDPMPRTILAIDEAQMILPASGGGLARQAIESFILEGRNFGLSIWMATQRPKGAISERAISQLDTLIAHRVSNSEDINAVSNLLQAAVPGKIKINDQDADVPSLLRSLDVGMALVSSDGGNAQRTFVMEMRPRVAAHGGKAF